MSIAYLLFWLIFILISLFLLLIFIPFGYKLKGRWEEKITGSGIVTFGPLLIEMARREDGAKISRFGFLGLRTKGRGLEGKKAKGEHKKKPTPGKKEESMTFTEFLSLLNRGLVGEVRQTLKTIFNKYRPTICEINGSVGFSDPYHTGLFAAICPFLPGKGVWADFSRDGPDVAFWVEGRVTLYILVFQGLRLLLSREGRKFMGKLIAIKKKRKNATRTPKAVYSTVK